jgi:hypothetical protein
MWAVDSGPSSIYYGVFARSRRSVISTISNYDTLPARLAFMPIAWRWGRLMADEAVKIRIPAARIESPVGAVRRPFASPFEPEEFLRAI